MATKNRNTSQETQPQQGFNEISQVKKPSHTPLTRICPTGEGLVASESQRPAVASKTTKILPANPLGIALIGWRSTDRKIGGQAPTQELTME
jgi:hypothetical protein